MDMGKFYSIIHRYHTFWNPVGVEKLNELYQLLQLKKGSMVLDIACGTGEMLVQLYEKYRIKGLGIDKAPYCISEAEKKRLQRAPKADLKFLQMDGKDYRPESLQSFDLAMCIGASWVYGGYRNTLRALRRMTKPGGLLMVGEPFWLRTPAKEYLENQQISEADFDTHPGNVAAGESAGLVFLYSSVSNQDDWDRYEGLHSYATAEYAESHPHDTDVSELKALDAKFRQSYLKWGRDTMGWAIYLFRKRD